MIPEQTIDTPCSYCGSPEHGITKCDAFKNRQHPVTLDFQMWEKQFCESQSNSGVKTRKAYKVVSSANNNKLTNDYIGSFFASRIANWDMEEREVDLTTMVWRDADHFNNDPTLY